MANDFFGNCSSPTVLSVGAEVTRLGSWRCCSRLLPATVEPTFAFSMPDPVRILYCHCAYAQVVPRDVKEAVLRQLSDSNVAFEAVADLCEMSARRDPALQRLAGDGQLKIAACFPRAVKWLFSAAQAPLNVEGCQVLNMRTQTAEVVAGTLLSPLLEPNLPRGKVTLNDAPQLAGDPTPAASVSPNSSPAV